MKRLLTTIILGTFFVIGFCQDDYHIVLLKINNKGKEYKHNNKNIIESVDNQKLKEVIVRYKAKNFSKCVKNARKEKLDNLYEMHIEGDITQFRNEIQESGEFEFIRELPIYKVEGCSNPLPPVNDPWIVNSWVNNYALDMIEANCAWSITTGDPNIIIGIADTEFKDHEDLRDNLAYLSGPITAKFPHGLWTAGCVSPVTNNGIGIAGLDYNTRIAGYRVAHSISSDGETAYGSPYSAIMQAYNDKRPVINVSWSGSVNDSDATDITNDGIVLVVSAGNSPDATSHSDIADIPGVILVSSVDANNNHAPTGHAHNEWVDLCAPGANVSTLEDPDSIKPCRGVWGTSNAAPYVTATVGLMLDVNKCLDPGELELVLEDNCDPIADAALFPGLLGAGRLNAYQAVLGAIEEGTNFVSGNIYGTSMKTGLYVSSLNTTIINSGGDVTFKAEKYTTLEPGFEVKLGAEFEILSGSYLCNQIVFPRDPLPLPLP